MKNPIFLYKRLENHIKKVRTSISYNQPRCTESGEDTLFQEYGEHFAHCLKRHFLPPILMHSEPQQEYTSYHVNL